jgi:anti-sigma regulatory factor (Ser/Thr protein kinase)
MVGEQRELWLPAEPTSAALARRAIREAARDAKLGPIDTSDVVLATSEAVANAIEHGSPRSDDVVRLRIRLDPGSITVEVGDNGRFPAPATSDERNRGRGLPLIGMLSDLVELDPRADGTVVRFAKHLSPPPKAADAGGPGTLGAAYG